jgi:hypothetical protein
LHGLGKGKRNGAFGRLKGCEKFKRKDAGNAKTQSKERFEQKATKETKGGYGETNIVPHRWTK